MPSESESQISTTGLPRIGPVMVPQLLKMMPKLRRVSELLMFPELVMMPSERLLMVPPLLIVPPKVFSMVPELSMVPMVLPPKNEPSLMSKKPVLVMVPKLVIPPLIEIEPPVLMIMSPELMLPPTLENAMKPSLLMVPSLMRVKVFKMSPRMLPSERLLMVPLEVFSMVVPWTPSSTPPVHNESPTAVDGKR